MKPKIEQRLRGYLVNIRGKSFFYPTLKEASARVAKYWNKRRRKR